MAGGQGSGLVLNPPVAVFVTGQVFDRAVRRLDGAGGQKRTADAGGEAGRIACGGEV
jgi:hypothetical protein